MGIIDQTRHTLNCSKCGASESVTILQHGSAYDGSWQSGKPMAQFTVTWSDADAFMSPSITSEKCNACGETPEIAVT